MNVAQPQRPAAGRPLRVQFVTHYFAPDGGAAANRLSRLASELARAGMEVRVLTTLPHYPEGRIRRGYRWRLWKRDEWRGIRVDRVWVSTVGGTRFAAKLLGHLSFMVTGFLRGLLLPRPDVMLVEAQPVFSGFGATMLARLRRVPYVLNVSDLWPDHLAGVGVLRETSPAYRLLGAIAGSAYGPARTIVAMTPLLDERIRQRIADPDKVTTVINGVDLVRFSPGNVDRQFARSMGIEGRRIVAFIGTFATAYDFECMLGVIERCSRTIPEALFLFIGTGSQMGAMGQRLAACPNVRMVEWLPSESVPAAWQSADLAWWVLRDSQLARGTIPAKMFEAFACGVPVVAGQRGVGAEMISRSGGGIVVEPGDVQATADAVESVVRSDARRRDLSAAARAWAESHFDCATGVRRYADYLRAAAGR